MERDLMRPVPVVFLLLAWTKTIKHQPKINLKSSVYHLDGPVVSPDLSCREATRSTSLLLDMEGNLATDFGWNLEIFGNKFSEFECRCVPFHISCRLCASCCAAFQRSWFPWSFWGLTPLLWNMWDLGVSGLRIRAQIEGLSHFSTQVHTVITEGQVLRTSASGRTTWKEHLRGRIQPEQRKLLFLWYLRQKTRMISCSQIFAI